MQKTFGEDTVDQGLSVRNILSARFVPWEDVREFAVRSVRTRGSKRYFVVVLREGRRRVRIQATWTSDRTKAERTAASIRACTPLR